MMIETVRDFGLTTVLITGMLACAPAPTTGPVEIHWDRQTCDRCQMVISERRHAVQVREKGARRAYAFDDLGCALHFLDEYDLATSAVEVWVRASPESPWIDAQTTRFETGLPTPMAYGFGASAEGLSLDEVREAVLRAEGQRRGGAVDAASKEDDQRG